MTKWYDTALSNFIDALQNILDNKLDIEDAFSGSYNDLTNKPSIPSKTSHLTNDSGFLTSHQDISGKADKSGYTASKNLVTNSNGQITTEDKPTIPSASSSTPSADVSGGSVGSSNNYAKADHQHPLSSAYATASHTQNLSTINNVTTVAVVVTYTDNTSETLNFVKYTGS